MILRWSLLHLQDKPHGPSASSQRESVKKKSEGLKQGCLAKGSTGGMGGKVAKMMVAVSHGKGVLTYERYEKRMRNILHLLLTNILTPCLNDLVED